MSNYVSYEAIEKFANSFNGSTLDEKLEDLGVESSAEAVEYFKKYANNDITPIMIDGGDSVSLFFATDVRYLEEYNNPLGDDPSYLNFKEFRSAKSRDDYLDGKNAKNYYLLEKYAHGAVHYSVMGTGNYPDRRWDVAEGCAVLEVGQELRSLRKALKTKHGEDEGNQKFISFLNEKLDNYSSYCNGFASEAVEVVVSKSNGEIYINTLGTFFDTKDLKVEAAYHAFHTFSAKRIKEIEEQIVQVGATDNLKGFDNNILRKGATNLEVFKHRNEDGLESKMAIVYFPEKVVTYVKTHDNVYNHISRKDTSTIGHPNVSFIKNHKIHQFALTIASSELMENAARYDLDKQEVKSGFKVR